jgi:tetratricopeptide (TPR) repeat protein
MAQSDNSQRIGAAVSQALALHQSGRLAEAEGLYRSILGMDQNQFEALHFLGLIEAQRGNNKEANRLISRSLKINNQAADAFANHARVLIALQRYDQAISACERALALDPMHLSALVNRGIAQKECGRVQEALALYDRALAFRPDYAAAWTNRGIALLALGRYDEALTNFNRALTINPRDGVAWIERGKALGLMGRIEEALQSCDRAVAIDPNHVSALTNRAIALNMLNRHDEALASCDRALAVEPQSIETLFHRGNALYGLERYQDALASYDQAVRRNPRYVDAVSNRGDALLKLGEIDRARSCYDRALAMNPAHVPAWRNLADLLSQIGNHHEALACYRRALAIKPDDATLLWNESNAYLVLRRFAEGWVNHEKRFDADRTLIRQDHPQPRWDGTKVAGTLLIWGEQGLGDQILHASMIPELAGQADELVLEVEPRLVDLFARSFPHVRAVAQGTSRYAGRVDMHVPIGGLGRHLRPDWESFRQQDEGYLTADAARAHALRARLHGDGRIVVGLSWKSKHPKFEREKSASLHDFAGLLRHPGFRFVDLQYGDTLADRLAVEGDYGVLVEHLDDVDNTKDIDGLAALISACDAVVTVSNTTAHLAGALGRPTWVFLPLGHARWWYWFKEGDACPWYPKLWLMRQGRGQSWGQLIGAHVDAISAGLRK